MISSDTLLFFTFKKNLEGKRYGKYNAVEQCIAVQILSFKVAASTSRSGKKMSVFVFMLKKNFVKSNNSQAP